MLVLGREGQILRPACHDRRRGAVAFFSFLAIEVAQAWMPSRSSNLHDLVLNTLGGGGGAFAVRRMRIFNF